MVIGSAALKRRTVVRSIGESFRRRSETLDIIVPVAGKDSSCLKEAVEAARKISASHKRHLPCLP